MYSDQKLNVEAHSEPRQKTVHYFLKNLPLELFDWQKQPPEVTLVQVFSCEFCEIFRNTFFVEHLRATASRMGSEYVSAVTREFSPD